MDKFLRKNQHDMFLNVLLTPLPPLQMIIKRIRKEENNQMVMQWDE